MKIHINAGGNRRSEKQLLLVIVLSILRDGQTDDDGCSR